MKILLLPMVLFGFVALFGAHAQLTPQWDIDFNAMTPGEEPATSNPIAGAVNHEPTRVTVHGEKNSILVQERFEAAPAVLDDQPVVFSYLSLDGGVNLSLVGAQEDVEMPGNTWLSFDMLISSEGLEAGNTLEIRMSRTASTASEQSVVRVIFTGRGDVLLFPAEGEGESFPSRWETDRVYNVQIFFDAHGDELQVTMDDGEGNGITDSIAIGGLLEERGIRSMHFRQGSDNFRWQGAIDNIKTAAEPPEAE